LDLTAAEERGDCAAAVGFATAWALGFEAACFGAARCTAARLLPVEDEFLSSSVELLNGLHQWSLSGGFDTGALELLIALPFPLLKALFLATQLSVEDEPPRLCAGWLPTQLRVNDDTLGCAGPAEEDSEVDGGVKMGRGLPLVLVDFRASCFGVPGGAAVPLRAFPISFHSLSRSRNSPKRGRFCRILLPCCFSSWSKVSCQRVGTGLRPVEAAGQSIGAGLEETLETGLGAADVSTMGIWGTELLLRDVEDRFTGLAGGSCDPGSFFFPQQRLKRPHIL
jgi:hypothetical protein